MPFVEGESLRARLDRVKRLSVADALRVAAEIADALDCAHRHNVLHRDVKPENILLAEGHAVVVDFGVARAIISANSEGSDDRITATGRQLHSCQGLRLRRRSTTTPSGIVVALCCISRCPAA